MPNPSAFLACLGAIVLLAAIGPATAQPAGITVCASQAPCVWFSSPALAALAAPGSGLATSTPVPLVLSVPGADGVAIRPVLFLLGIVYNDAHFQGQSLAFYDQGGCHIANTPLIDMPAAFDNAISSIDGGYSGCQRLIPYDLPGGAGEWPVECTPDCPTMGEMDDRTSSIQFWYEL